MVAFSDTMFMPSFMKIVNWFKHYGWTDRHMDVVPSKTGSDISQHLEMT